MAKRKTPTTLPTRGSVAADTVDRMQAWGRDLAAKLDARMATNPPAVSPHSEYAATLLRKSASKARQTALAYARAGDPRCATWQSRYRELLRETDLYQWAKEFCPGNGLAQYGETSSDASLRQVWQEAIRSGAPMPQGYSTPQSERNALHYLNTCMQEATVSPGYNTIQRAIGALSSYCEIAPNVTPETMIQLPCRRPSPISYVHGSGAHPATWHGETSAELSEYLHSLEIGPQAPAEPAEEPVPPAVAETIAAELDPQSLTRAECPPENPEEEPSMSRTYTVRRHKRETPAEREERIEAWRASNMAERERRRLAAAEAREARRQAWRMEHGRGAVATA